MKSLEDLNTCAIELRKSWGLSNYELVDLTSILPFKLKDLTIIFYPMEDNVSGICSKNTYGDIILINSTNSKGRQRFTIAHELYHLLFEDGLKEIICLESDKNNPSEVNADNFASRFLMPIEGLKNFKNQNNIKQWSLDEIIFAEQHFQISHHAMLYRLLTEEYITKEEYEEWYDIGITYEAKKRGFDIELYKPSYKGNDYYSLGSFVREVEEAYSEGRITESKKKSLLLDGFRGDIY